MVKKIVRVLSLVVMLSTAMPLLHGMHRFKKGWSRVTSAFKGGFGRFGFKTSQWSKSFAKNSGFFKSFAKAHTFNSLSGITAAATLAYPMSSLEGQLLLQQVPQPRAQIEFTPTNIDAHENMKQSFIEYAKKNITTKNAAIANTIIYLIKKYPDAAVQLYPFVLLNCKQVNPMLQKAVGAQCLVAPKVKKEEKPQQTTPVTKTDAEEDGGFITVGNMFQYGLLPVLDIDIPHATDKDNKRVNLWDITEENMVNLVEIVDGKCGFKSVDKWPKAIASEIATDTLLWGAGKAVEDLTGYSLACPPFKNDNSWNVDNRMCRLTTGFIKHGIVKPWMRSHIVEPVIGK